MDCLSEEVLQDLIDGELSDSTAAQAIRHIRSCDRCRQELTELLTLYEGLGQVMAEDTCPSRTTLLAYTQEVLSGEMMATVKKHLEFCSECRSYIWLLTASESELATWQAQEERDHRQYGDMLTGREAAREALAGLLPVGLEFLDRLWGSARALVQDLRTRPVGQWPQFGTSGQVTGALGFAGPADPERTATAIILLSTLFVGERISSGEIGTSMDEIAAAVREASQAFAAGKELQKRLIETIPPILRKFYGRSDAHPFI